MRELFIIIIILGAVHRNIPELYKYYYLILQSTVFSSTSDITPLCHKRAHNKVTLLGHLYILSFGSFVTILSFVAPGLWLHARFHHGPTRNGGGERRGDDYSRRRSHRTTRQHAKCEIVHEPWHSVSSERLNSFAHILSLDASLLGAPLFASSALYSAIQSFCCSDLVSN